MSNTLLRNVCGTLLASGALMLSGIAAAESTLIPAAGPVFGVVTAPDGSILATDAGTGVQEYREVSAADRNDLFGEQLPAGLRLSD